MSRHAATSAHQVNHELHHAILASYVYNLNENAPLEESSFIPHYQELFKELTDIQGGIPSDSLEARRFLNNRLDEHKKRVAQDHYRAIMEDRVINSRPKDDRLYMFVNDIIRLIDSSDAQQEIKSIDAAYSGE